MRLKIRELREEFQWTQHELAQKISNAQRNVSNWEAGINEPDCETILKLADLFDVSLDELFGRNYSEQKKVGVDSDADKALLLAVKRLNTEQKLAIKILISSFLK